MHFSQQRRRVNRFVLSRDIASTVRDIISEDRSEHNNTEAPEGMTLQEKMARWMLDSAEDGATALAIPDLACPSDHSEPDSEHNAALPEIQAYRDIIQSAPSYAKLLVDLRREMTIQPSNPDVMAAMRNRVIAMLPQSRRISRRGPPETFCMTFNVDWDPLAFVRQQEYEQAAETAIRDAIVVTGGIVTAQATTCVEYLQQTWPSIGEQILDLIGKALRPPYSSGIALLKPMWSL
jgi:hypothetical protein